MVGTKVLEKLLEECLVQVERELAHIYVVLPDARHLRGLCCCTEGGLSGKER